MPHGLADEFTGFALRKLRTQQERCVTFSLIVIFLDDLSQIQRQPGVRQLDGLVDRGTEGSLRRMVRIAAR
jgi:hypothetical protein